MNPARPTTRRWTASAFSALATTTNSRAPPATPTPGSATALTTRRGTTATSACPVTMGMRRPSCQVNWILRLKYKQDSPGWPITWCYAMLCDVTWCYVMSCVMLFYVMLCDAMCCYMMLCDVMWFLTFLGSCKPCMCPGNVNDPNALVHSPNKSCSISGLSFVCDCEKGYSGSRCDSCGYGYYGTPANMTVIILWRILWIVQNIN